jgi:hypothetical protein
MSATTPKQENGDSQTQSQRQGSVNANPGGPQTTGRATDDKSLPEEAPSDPRTRGSNKDEIDGVPDENKRLYQEPL